jgi:NTE family protein
MTERKTRRGPRAASASRADRRTGPRATGARKQINVALQGGGSHGAFTWGVLDRLLEDDGLRIVEISGASAGAMNAAVVAQGLAEGGEQAARAALARFWRSVAAAAVASPIQRGPLAFLTGDWSLDNSPGFLAADLLSRVASPYDLNPAGLNPLRKLLETQVDFEKVRCCGAVAVHVATTCVETGRPAIFSTPELTPEVILASACLPTLFHAVRIGDKHYWDGGYSGNPPLYPFFGSSPTEDIVIVQINPILRPGTPTSAREIADRVNEITFNHSLMAELRAIGFVNRLIDSGRLQEGDGYRAMRIHMVEARKALRPLGASSKLNAEWAFLKHLFGIGRDAAERWLARHRANLGVRGTLDLDDVIGRKPEATEAAE